MRTFIIALLTFMASTAAAQATVDFCSLGTEGLVIDAKPMNGAAATLTFTFGPRECARNVASFQWLIIEGEFTYSSKTGNVLITCTNGRSVATATHTPQTCVGAGTCTTTDAGIFSTAVGAANKNWSVRLGIRGYRAWSCVVSHDNSPTASELFTGYAYLTD
ncbi:MAG: hypothetical protein ACYTEX_23290 [Planctomycetota bacterium]|jgi:hypothetical protein